MAFLDNSGDIILDAVLTDAGRQRLARGDGSFKITQFALGDDEINYGLYDATNANGSAYYDLNILQTPILEAFTNNVASLNSKLLSIPRKDLLYLPVIKLSSTPNKDQGDATIIDAFVVISDQNTEDNLKNDTNIDQGNGIIFGYSIANSAFISTDQGIDTLAAGASDTKVSQDLKETQYIVEIDNRLATIIQYTSTANITSVREAAKSFVDDDNIAQYYFSLTDEGFVSELVHTSETNDTIVGPKGTQLLFGLRSSLDIQSSKYLFDTFGQAYGSDPNYKIIKSNIVVTGVTTGYSVTIPVVFLKKVA